MSTNCYIGREYEKPDGSKYVRYIYCHWDGYPAYMIPMLTQNYATPEKVEELINLGYASCICKNLNPIGKHSFDEPEKDVSVFYGRDRGEDGCGATVTSLETFRNISNDYTYLFGIDDTWYSINRYGEFEYMGRA